MSNHTLAVYMGNLVDTTYTGVYQMDIFVHFYPAEKGKILAKNEELLNGVDSNADLIIPISRDLPLNDGLWFEIENSTDIESKEFRIPRNAYKAVLEVYVSPHENDEFWYTNYPNEYIAVNNLTGLPGNGPFREVLVSLDGELVGVIWPFTVIYTGGIDPLLWRPISGIGSFDLPSYDIEITPSLGTLLDGNTHELAFSVNNALNVWYVDANLHIWLDEKSEKTKGRILKKETLPPVIHLETNFSGLDGTFYTNVRRLVTSTGWVKSSRGKITTKFSQELNYTNFMDMGKDGNLQIVQQRIDFHDNVIAKTASNVSHSVKSLKSFPLFVHSESKDQGNGTYTLLANLTLGFNEKKVKVSEFGSSVGLLKNLQKGQASVNIKDNLVVSGVGSTQQVYNYESTGFCYRRSVKGSNYTIIYDKVSDICS